MRTRRILALLMALALLLPCLSVLAEPPTQEEINGLLEAKTDRTLIESPLLGPIKQARKSVVTVNIYSKPPRGRAYTYDDDASITGGGSGTVVSPWGHVLTNAHVVRGSSISQWKARTSCWRPTWWGWTWTWIWRCCLSPN